MLLTKGFSNVIKINAPKLENNLHCIYPLDKQGVYMGDGGKLITIDVVNNINFFNERILRSADTVVKVNSCYLSLSTGEVFSYSQVAANTSLSSKIDFGIYGQFVPPVPATGNTAAIPSYWRYYLYSLSKSPSAFPLYDISTWTKKATLFSNRLTTGAADFIKVTGSTTLADLASKVTINQLGPIQVSNSAPSAGAPDAPIGNSYLYFKTPEGKVGALYLSSTGNNYKTGRYFVFQIKMQK